MSGEARDRSIVREEAERRELEAAGWEPKGRGAKTIWRSPAGDRWYAHYQALGMHRKAEVDSEEERLLREHGFARVQVGDRELWERYQQDSLRLYVRAQALRKARKKEE